VLPVDIPAVALAGYALGGVDEPLVGIDVADRFHLALSARAAVLYLKPATDSVGAAARIELDVIGLAVLWPVVARLAEGYEVAS
jgi:hypothetical protein